MEWRKLTPADLDTGLRIHSELLGNGSLTVSEARKLWGRLLGAPGFAGVAVTGRRGRDEDFVFGFGAGVFVEETFAEAEMATPRPGLNDRVIQHILPPNSIVFERGKIAVENSRHGVTIVVLCGRWNPVLSYPAEIDEAQILLSSSFAEWHAGYRFKRILIEVSSKEDRKFSQDTPIVRIHREFGGSRALGVVEREDMVANQGSVLRHHFACPAPKLFLGPKSQELLLAALEGLTDEELRLRLNVTKAAVKQRWLAIYDVVGARMPGLFPSTNGSNGNMRGPQKRHLVLSHIRKHPEELRPYTRRLAAKA